MQIDKAFFVKELMDRKGEGMTHAKYGAKRIGTKAQMCDLAQIFETRFVLELKWVCIGITFAQYLDRPCFDLYRLTLAKRCYELPVYLKRGSRGYFFKQLVLKSSQLRYYLQIVVGRTII